MGGWRTWESINDCIKHATMLFFYKMSVYHDCKKQVMNSGLTHRNQDRDMLLLKVLNVLYCDFVMEWTHDTWRNQTPTLHVTMRRCFKTIICNIYEYKCVKTTSPVL